MATRIFKFSPSDHGSPMFKAGFGMVEPGKKYATDDADAIAAARADSDFEDVTPKPKSSSKPKSGSRSGGSKTPAPREAVAQAAASKDVADLRPDTSPPPDPAEHAAQAPDQPSDAANKETEIA